MTLVDDGKFRDGLLDRNRIEVLVISLGLETHMLGEEEIISKRHLGTSGEVKPEVGFLICPVRQKSAHKIDHPGLHLAVEAGSEVD